MQTARDRIRDQVASVLRIHLRSPQCIGSLPLDQLTACAAVVCGYHAYKGKFLSFDMIIERIGDDFYSQWIASHRGHLAQAVDILTSPVGGVV